MNTAVRRLCLALGLAAVLAGAQAQAPDESLAAAALIAAPTAAAEPGTAAETAALAASAQPINNEQLKREIEDLRALLKGELPQHTALRSLFEIDLGDEAAVALRVQTLKERLSSSEASASAVELPESLSLRNQRAQLRLAFLSLPLERRNGLREQDRLQRAREALALEQQTSARVLATTEQARDAALAAANQATDDGARMLANEKARLLAHSSELASLRQSWAMGNQAQLETRKALLERYSAIDAGTAIPAAQADKLYAAIRDDLKTLRGEAAAALDAVSSPSVVVPLAEPLALNRPEFASQAEAVAALQLLRLQVANAEDELRGREAEERYQDAEKVMLTLQTLQARRIALLPMLSPSFRATVTGFTQEGLHRVTSEIWHLRLMAGWYPLQRIHSAKSFASVLRNMVGASRLGAGLTGLLVVLALLYVVHRRVLDWLRKLRAWLAMRVQPRSLMLRVDGLIQMLSALAKELILLLAVYVVFELLLRGPNVAELGALRHLAYAYAYYTLSLAFIHRVLLTAVSRYRAVSPTLNRKILQSLRLVARLGLLVSFYLIIAQALLGRGALYDIARGIAVFGALLVAWRLIRSWRDEVTGTYLKISPEGRLANMVRASKSRSYGLLIAVPAFLFIAALGVWAWLRDLALGFEQTRKALAYLFRRQLERQSKNQPPLPDPSLLPDALQAALTEEPADETLSIDHFPQMAEVLARAQAMAAGGPGALLAIVAERGAGKTTWLMALQRQLAPQLRCTLHTFESRTTDPDVVCRQLSVLLGVPETTDPQRLIADTLEQPPQVALLDLAQNLMLRAVGGLAAYELFLRVAQATTGRVLWMSAFARWPFEYLERTHPGRDVYDEVLKLPVWSEEDIGALIDARLEAAGFTADYDQLLLNTASVAAPLHRYSAAAMEAAERTADRYYRLIWDYADGNPRIALHFFRLSLAFKGDKKVSVRLFPMPEGDGLEDTAPRTRFVLSCLVQHENMTAEEAAQSLGFPLRDCAYALDNLHRQGFLAIEAGRRYRVTSHWNRAVQRFLQRKKLLVV